MTGACNYCIGTRAVGVTTTYFAYTVAILKHTWNTNTIFHLRSLRDILSPAIQTTGVFVSPPTVHIHATFNAALPRLTVLQSIDASAIAHRVRTRHTDLTIVGAFEYRIVETMTVGLTH